MQIGIGLRNAKDKATGYEKVFENIELKYNVRDVDVNVFYNSSTGFKELAKYYTKVFDKLFGE